MMALTFTPKNSLVSTIDRLIADHRLLINEGLTDNYEPIQMLEEIKTMFQGTNEI